MMEEHPNGLYAFVKVGEYLEEHDWHPQRIPDKYTYRTAFHGKNGNILCYAQVRIEAEQLVFYAMAPIKIAEEQRPTVAEFLTRANYGMYIGNFEMDWNDGEVRYKSSIDFEGTQLNDLLIRNTIYPAVRLMDRYLPGLFKVAYGGVSPLDAVREIED
ncbi:MAG: YbjN domain-containing protein [Chloroflexaceae bacterium]|nr:YbjN domain-containing protein [Chloroflexaceae bacterium]